MNDAEALELSRVVGDAQVQHHKNKVEPEERKTKIVKVFGWLFTLSKPEKQKVSQQVQYAVKSIAQNKNFQVSKEENPISFTIYDLGGQHFTQSIHSLLISTNALFMVVVDLRKLVDDTEKDLKQLKIWINHIAIHADDPKVFIIGTHFDLLNVGTELSETEKSIRSVTKEFDTAMCFLGHGKHSFYPISNRDRTQEGTAAIPQLRENVKTEASKIASVNEKIPILWMLLLNHLRTFKSKACIQMEELLQKAEEFKIEKSDCKKMLQYFHQRGVLLYWSSIGDTVVLKPQWVIDAVGMVIHDKKLHGHQIEKQLKGKTTLQNMMNELYEEGHLYEQLLDEVLWIDPEFQKKKAFLIKVIKQTLLMSELPPKNGKKRFLVPALANASVNATLLREHNDEIDTEWGNTGEICPDACKVCRGRISMKFVPEGLFERIICLLQSYFSRTKKAGKLRFSNNQCMYHAFINGEFVGFVKLDTNISDTSGFYIQVTMKVKTENDFLNLLVNDLETVIQNLSGLFFKEENVLDMKVEKEYIKNEYKPIGLNDRETAAKLLRGNSGMLLTEFEFQQRVLDEFGNVKNHVKSNSNKLDTILKLNFDPYPMLWTISKKEAWNPFRNRCNPIGRTLNPLWKTVCIRFRCQLTGKCDMEPIEVKLPSKQVSKFAENHATIFKGTILLLKVGLIAVKVASGMEFLKLENFDFPTAGFPDVDDYVNEQTVEKLKSSLENVEESLTMVTDNAELNKAAEEMEENCILTNDNDTAESYKSNKNRQLLRKLLLKSDVKPDNIQEIWTKSNLSRYIHKETQAIIAICDDAKEMANTLGYVSVLKP